MSKLHICTLLVGAMLALGEIGRWWGNPRFVPLAFDEVLVAAGMVAAVLGARRFGPAPLAAAWGGFCGLTLSLFVETLNHLFHGPPKDSAAFYATVLGLMLGLGLWALWSTLGACRLAYHNR